MPRPYDPQSVIELPRLDADSAISVCTALLTLAAKEKKLPPHVQTARTLLEGAVSHLQATRLAEPQTESGLLAAMRAEAAAWTAFERFLQALAGVPGVKAVAAQALLDAVFADGQQFLRGKVLKRWPATHARIQHLNKEPAAAEVKTVGAEELVAHLAHMHAATGEAAGITVPKPVVEAPLVRDKLDAVKAALRAYVAQFVAMSALDPTVQTLTDKLLAPLADYAPTSNAKTAAATVAAAEPTTAATAQTVPQAEPA